MRCFAMCHGSPFFGELQSHMYNVCGRQVFLIIIKVWDPVQERKAILECRRPHKWKLRKEKKENEKEKGKVQLCGYPL